jgi:hypothetical protein
VGMSLTTYADLLTAIGVELNRTDLSGIAPDLITRFEARARRELRDWLRTTINLTNVTGDTVLAATVSDVLSVSYHDGANGAHNFPLDLLTKEAYQAFMEAQSALVSTAGQAVYVDADIDAGTTTLRFWPPAGSSAPIANLQVEVIKVLPSLSTTQTANALLREAPDLYLNGSCAEAAKYLAHDERVALWASERDQGFKALRILTERRLYGGAPRRRVLPVVFG